jgi:hypothetical protein
VNESARTLGEQVWPRTWHIGIAWPRNAVIVSDQSVAKFPIGRSQDKFFGIGVLFGVYGEPKIAGPFTTGPKREFFSPQGRR